MSVPPATINAETRADGVPPWARRTILPALLLSLAGHACFIVIAALVLVRGGGVGDEGEGGGAGGPVEMAVMTQGDLAALEAAADAAGALPAIPDLPPESGPQDPMRTDDTIVADAAVGGATQATSVGDLGGGGDLSSGTGGMGLGGSGGGGPGASFFGVEATGSRFAFLVDVSSSMDGRRIINLREQLTKSVNAMTPTSSFVVVAFSTTHMVVGDKAEWREASDAGKRWARAQFGALMPNGGTEPLSGLEVIHTMRPRPDAIYFMTDGEFNDIMPAIKELREKAKIPIHCICRGSKKGELAMKEIAAFTKGTYKFVPE